jgi:hypothetical protein
LSKIFFDNVSDSIDMTSWFSSSDLACPVNSLTAIKFSGTGNVRVSGMTVSATAPFAGKIKFIAETAMGQQASKILDVRVCGDENPVVLLESSQLFEIGPEETLELEIDKEIVKSSEPECSFSNFKLYLLSTGLEASSDVYKVI